MYHNGSIVASASILATPAGLPVYIPSLPPKIVVRPRLIERLNVGLSACNKPEGMLKEFRLEKEIAHLHSIFEIEVRV